MGSLNIPDSAKAPSSPVFVHPIPNPNGDPLDFSFKNLFWYISIQSHK